MRARTKLILNFTAFFILATAVVAQEQVRIYGRITTIDEDSLQGFIRWDKNEVTWVDILNGSKEIPREHMREARELDRQRDDRSFFGFRLGRDDNKRWSSSSSSGIRFGHIKRLEPTGSNRARLLLKSGQEIEFSGGGTDIGNSNRGIIIEDGVLGQVELRWSSIQSVDFAAAPRSGQSVFGTPLYGTLTTRGGEQFTGLICWDIDEVFASDILDGKERGRSYKIEFDKIAAIERYSSSGARVFLKSGEELVLRGSNDVDDSNRGISVSDPKLGQITVNWRNFSKIVFETLRADFSYADFDGGRPLLGTVTTEAGEIYSGTIRWDNDEEFTWEMLDGDFDDIDFDIEFGNIGRIEKESSRAALVVLHDGREFRLRDSNDVDSSNRGIFITLRNGDKVVIDWDAFKRAEFQKK